MAGFITSSPGCGIARGMRNHMARDVHDESRARALVLDNGHAEMAFVVSGLCVVAPEMIGIAKALIERPTGIPARGLISAGHAHTPPAARISGAVRRARRRIRPARVRRGTGTGNRLGFQRRFGMQPG
ncbi:MAG: hypothetical protein LC126_12790 [Bryobacterales bacterium]|nr:hypothetical protein [Bryobacterales bacterium]